MEKVVKKRSLKKVLKKRISKVGQFFTNLWNKLKAMSKKGKILLGVWSAIAILLIIILIIVSSNKKYFAKYESIEQKVAESAILYAKDKEIYYTPSQKLHVYVDMLLEQGYLTKDDVQDETCTGYALVFYDDGINEFKASSYIKCKSYITDDYEK